MRNWNQYLELWQQKRNELHIGTDEQADWSEMHDLLDKHLPVQNPGSVGGPGTGQQASNLVKQLSDLTKFKLFYAVGGLILAGAVTYFVTQHRAAIKNNKVAKTAIRRDSLANYNNAVTDSLSTSRTTSGTDSVSDHQNLSSAAIPPANVPGKGDVNTGQPTINNKDDASSKNTSANSSSYNNNRTLSSSNNLTNGLRLNGNGRSASNTYTGNNKLGVDANSNNQQTGGSGSTASYNRRDYNAPLLIPHALATTLNWNDIMAGNKTYSTSLLAKLNRRLRPVRILSNPAEKTKVAKNAGNNKKPTRSKNSTRNNSTGSDLDWGILAGINSNGGFTPKAQNHNIYGSLSPDIHLGLFGTYNINDHWAVGFQGKFFVPHSISGMYDYTHKLSADTSHTSQILTISDSRKIYTVDVPIYAIYKVTPNISFKAGAILSMPVKQINGTNSFIISGPLRDSAVYYNSVTNDINASRFDKKIRVGASAGVSFAYKFLLLDATYNFQGQKVSSALGSYNVNANSLQLTLGIKFNKSKK